jgi:hypothetical protein
VRRYQCGEPSSPRVVVGVERGEDASSQRGWAAAVDELEQRVDVCPPIAGERDGESRLEADPLEPSPAPRDETDEISVDVRRM